MPIDRRTFNISSIFALGATALSRSVFATEGQTKLTSTKGTTMSTYPRTFSHIGISVPDVEKAAKFYSEVMGWYHIMEPTVITEEADTPIGQMCIDVFECIGGFPIS